MNCYAYRSSYAYRNSIWWPWLSAASFDAMQRYGVRSLGVLAEPLTVEEARMHLRIDPNDDSPAQSEDDPWIEDIGIPGARDWCEGYLERSIAQQTMELSANGFPSGFSTRSGLIELPFGPIISVISVTYTDVDGVDQIMPEADYQLDTAYTPRLILAYGATWPVARDFANSVKIQYVTGYNLAGDSPQTNPLPSGIRIALLLMLGHLFINREDTIAGPAIAINQIPNGAAAFLERYRVRLSMA